MAKILVVDDLPDNIQLLRYDLGDDGHTVVDACNGYECLELCEREQPDLILLDMMMPGISGLETLRQLKQHPVNSNIPVIMVSADDADDIVIDALDLGAHDYVSKPVVYPVLAARIRSALRLLDAQKELSQANARLELLASTDPLTNLYNRRYFLKLTNLELTKALRFKRPLSLIMIDADHFKQVNDKYGHAAGDNALVSMANAFKKMCRESDIIGRLGGEEFYICCPDANLPGARKLAERIRLEIKNNSIQYQCNSHRELQQFSLTVSIGVTEYQMGETLETLSARTDKQLYLAKNTGRDCVAQG